MILDTTFIIDLLRGKNLEVKEKAEELDHLFETKAVVSVSVMELWRGALQSVRKEEEKNKINELINSFLVYPFDEKTARESGEIEADLIKKGEIIDLEDIMIAGVAKVHNETVLTRNVKHFERISGLSVETY